MKIFISHSSLDMDLAKVLSGFFESISTNIEVFCSSITGHVRIGRDFVDVISKKLNDCDAFIPLLTENYYKSRYCMIELGFAYAYLNKLSPDHRYEYIFPIAVPPVKKGEALASTPLARLQTGSINDTEDTRIMVEELCAKGNMSCKAGMNNRIHAFIYDVNKLIFGKYNLLSDAILLACKAGNVPGADEDYISYSKLTDKNGYAINFRVKPYDNSTALPDFLSFVYKFVDRMNLYAMVNVYPDAQLRFDIYNYTNSLSKITVEIKHSVSNLILEKRSISLGAGLNQVSIPLREIMHEALKEVSEICFVLFPGYYTEEEGMFQIIDMELLPT
jgi:hypothetical protein